MRPTTVPSSILDHSSIISVARGASLPFAYDPQSEWHRLAAQRRVEDDAVAGIRIERAEMHLLQPRPVTHGSVASTPPESCGHTGVPGPKICTIKPGTELATQMVPELSMIACRG